MEIRILKENETVRYAAEELKKYFKLVDESVEAEITCAPVKSEGGITLAILSDIGLSDEDVDDALIDDVVDVDITNLSGYIAGSNPRSILMGVYKYFKSVGCRWVRPGDTGEYIVKADLKKHNFKFRKKADHPFRGECGDGAVGFEHIRDTIVWMPKVDMNLFMLQQLVPYNFLQRWYRHVGNTKLSHDDIPYQQYCDISLEIERLVKKCGLQLHMLGHGGTYLPFGVVHKTVETNDAVPEETKKNFALVNGRRDLYKGSPFFTQVCMSQKAVQERVTDWLVDLLKKKPHIDFLHFWLGDAENNHCECEECVKKHPSDWYVDMLNMLDSKLTAIGNKSKIVFIIYVDTLWPSVKEKLNNPSRFILTSACGTGVEYSAPRREGGIPKWERNNFKIDGGFDIAQNFVDGWKPIFDGPRFIFEYSLYMLHFYDPGYMAFSRNIANDMKAIESVGFDGIMSCQTHRAAFPTALPNTLLGEFLFDASIDTESFIDDYLEKNFGVDYKSAKDYLNKISNAFKSFDSVLLGRIEILGNGSLGDAISVTPKIIDEYISVIEKNLTTSDPCHRESWKILKYHSEYCKRLSEILVALSRNDTDSAKAYFGELIDYLSDAEAEIHPYFDLCLFNRTMKKLVSYK